MSKSMILNFIDRLEQLHYNENDIDDLTELNKLYLELEQDYNMLCPYLNIEIKKSTRKTLDEIKQSIKELEKCR